MARASIRWAGLLVSIIAALVILTSIFSPATFSAAQGVANEIRDRFQDNASPGGINENLGNYVPLVYGQVHSWWHRLFPDSEELRGLQLLHYDDEIRCRVYTYYDKSAKSEDTEALLQVWLKAWYALDMTPVILTNDMASKHAQYDALHQKYQGTGVELQKIDAIMAMDQMGFEGMLMSNFVFPMAEPDNPLLKQMRQCQVLDVVTRYAGSKDYILRGSSMAFKVLVKTLANNDQPLVSEEIENLGLGAVPVNSLRELEDPGTFAVYDPATVKRLYPTLYSGRAVEQGGKSFTFAKHQLASLVNSHLQDNFLSNYRAGIEVLSPKLPIVDSEHLYKPAMKIAMEMMRCNLTPLPRSCPPHRQPEDGTCFQCHQLVSSAVIVPVEGYIPKNETFFIGNVAHPLTLMSVGQDSRDHMYTAATIRDSPRDMWSKKTLTPSLRPKAGALQGLVMLSNSLWHNEDNYLPNNHIWRTFENIQSADLEYEVGFILPELEATLDALARTTATKSARFQRTTAELIPIVNDQTNEGKHDGDVVRAKEIMEAWSQYDVGAFQLIDNYVQFQGKRLEHMKTLNRGAFAVTTLT